MRGGRKEVREREEGERRREEGKEDIYIYI